MGDPPVAAPSPARPQARMLLYDREIGRAFQPLLDIVTGALHDRVLTCLHALHVDANGAVDRDTVVGAAPCEMSGIRARHQGFGRHATRIDARSAELLALDERNLFSRRGKAGRQRRTRLPRTNY